MARRLLSNIPSAELAIIPNADHAAAEQPLFWHTVRAFIERHSEPPPE